MNDTYRTEIDKIVSRRNVIKTILPYVASERNLASLKLDLKDKDWKYGTGQWTAVSMSRTIEVTQTEELEKFKIVVKYKI